MKKLWVKLFLLATALSVFLPAIAAAAKKAPLVVVAHTTKLTGMQALWGNIYNDDPVLFTIITGVLIPIFGCTFGIVADFIMGYTGIDLKTRELREH